MMDIFFLKTCGFQGILCYIYKILILIYVQKDLKLLWAIYTIHPYVFHFEKSYIYLFYIEEIWLIYHMYHIYECMLCVFLWLLYNVRLRIFCSHGTSPLTVVKGCKIWFHRRIRYCHFNVHVRNAEVFIDASLGLISMTIWKHYNCEIVLF